MNKGPCVVENCSKPQQAKGFCPMHYQRQRRFGDVNYVQAPPTPEETAARFWSKVDKAGPCWRWTAFIDHGGYGRFHADKKFQPAHRIAYRLSVGEIPEGMAVDHVSCVNPAHLRLATTKQNAENRIGANAHSKSGIRGVHWHRVSKRWCAQVTHNYTRYVEYFDTKEEAEAWAVEMRKNLYTHTIERSVA